MVFNVLKVVEFRLCYVLVHVPGTNAVVVDIPQSDAVVLECLYSCFHTTG